MIKYILIISIFSPGGDHIRNYESGPFDTSSECIKKLKEVKGSPNLYGLNFRLQCVKNKKESLYVQW